MIGDISGATSIYIITGKTDMRKSINGLCAIVYDMMGQEINRNSIYLFCGTRCDRIKILLKEPDGITLLYNSSEVKPITWCQFDWLMSCLDIEQPKAIGNVK